LRDVRIRTQSAAVASWRATDLATHPSDNLTDLFIGLELDAGLQVLEHDQQLDQNVTPAPKEALSSHIFTYQSAEICTLDKEYASGPHSITKAWISIGLFNASMRILKALGKVFR
jgi:hypothetical protein